MTDTNYLYQYFLDKSKENNKITVSSDKKKDIRKSGLESKQEEKKNE